MSGDHRMNKTEKFWDRIAKGYDTQVIKLDETEAKTVEMAKKHLNNSDVVLDYGCGPGAMTSEMAKEVKEIHGIDISSSMIEIAKRIATERNIENIHYAQGTIFDQSYKQESFNVILAFNILHLLEDIHEVMPRINELLKQGGKFLSITPSMGTKRSLLGVLLSLLSKIGIIPYTNIPTRSELEGFITYGNFQVVEIVELQRNPSNYFIAAEKL
jgi:2-polyprenyl-3-methyl-5-hydroxy-6-metoxy-1,4-benzoquinol methylase